MNRKSIFSNTKQLSLQINGSNHKTCAEGCRFGFNGKEKDDETYGTGNAYDFGARIYDARLGRWLSIDAMHKKYPSLTSYHFTGNSPIVFVDHDGNDFGVTVNHTAGTIILTSNIYSTNQVSYNQALKASGEFNSLSKTATINGKSYIVSFQVNVVPPTDGGAKIARSSMYKDPMGNLYKGQTGSTEIQGFDSKAIGGTNAGGRITEMNTITYPGIGGIPTTIDAGDNSELLSHEFLHQFGLDDKGGEYYSDDGRMSYTATPENGFKLKAISNSDITNILKYAIKNDEKNNKGDKNAIATISQTGNGDIKVGNGENIKVEDTKY